MATEGSVEKVEDGANRRRFWLYIILAFLVAIAAGGFYYQKRVADVNDNPQSVKSDSPAQEKSKTNPGKPTADNHQVEVTGLPAG